ncbi:MAG: hypothetical protein Q4G46_03795 [Propionibacteriaceae bacterium]|nr:hypothetical protein [Propionibacteriaceae bacterium]
MQAIIWFVVFGAAILPSAAPITRGRGQHVDEKQLARYVRSRRLPLPDELRQPVLQRIRRRERAAMWWGSAGLAVGLVAALIVEGVTDGDGLSGLLVCLPAAFGMGLGGFFGARRPDPMLRPDAPRVARPRATDLADYSTAPEGLAVRLVPVTVLAAALVALLVWVMVPLRPPGGVAVPVLIGLATAGVLVLWWLLLRAERRLIDLPQHAHSDLELAWDDATRVDAVRGVRDTSVAVGVLTTFGLLVVAGTWVINPEVRAQGMDLTMWLGFLAFGVGVVCWAALLVPWGIGRQRPNPVLGLWAGRFQEA